MEQHLTGALAENGISLWGGSIPELELKLELLGGDLIQRVRGGRVGERVKSLANLLSKTRMRRRHGWAASTLLCYHCTCYLGLGSATAGRG